MRTGAGDMRGGDAGELRIGDSDRDQISDVLSEHVAEGRLTIDELDQRLGILYAARTRAQAAAVLADLPPLGGLGTTHHFHVGHAPEDAVPALPDWLTEDARPQSPASTQGSDPTVRPAAAAAALAAPEGRAAARKRIKLRAGENAIGHTFQAKRRAINAELQRASSKGKSEEMVRLQEQLREAQDIATSARQAVAAGDRAGLQRQLARLRALS